MFCFHRIHFTHGKISSDCMAAEVRPERAGNKSKVFFIWIAKMPVNFTYGLAFHFAGCSAEIKQKGKSTQKGFLFNPVVPTLSLLRYQCRRRTHNQWQQPSVPPPVLQLGVLGGHQGLKSSLASRQQTSGAGAFPAVGARMLLAGETPL